MITAFILSMAVAADEPVPVVPPPVISPAPAPTVPRPPIEALPNGVPNLVSLFSSDDYPAEAIRNEEEGMVEVRLMVTTDGRVGNCQVLASSGSVSLDRATCQILQRRARFKPARDEAGRPTIDYYTQRVRWELPDELRPFITWAERMIIRFDGSSKVVGCRFELNGQGQELPDCSQTQSLVKTLLAGREDQARGMSLVIDRRFEANPTGGLSEQKLSKWELPLARGVVEFDIDPTGRPHNCRQLVREGDKLISDMCSVEVGLNFEPATAANAGSRRGRISFASYLEPLIMVRPTNPPAKPR